MARCQGGSFGSAVRSCRVNPPFQHFRPLVPLLHLTFSLAFHPPRLALESLPSPLQSSRLLKMKLLHVISLLLPVSAVLAQDQLQLPLKPPPNVTILSKDKVDQWVIPAWYAA